MSEMEVKNLRVGNLLTWKDQEALNWWYNILTESERSNFPKPKDNEDILAYYTNPAENINLDYDTYMSAF